MHQVHPILPPQLRYHKKIDSLRSLKHISMKNYKSLSKLKIFKQSLDTPKINFHNLSKIKSLKSLDLSSFNLKNLTIPQTRLLIKAFYKIQQFSAPSGSLLPSFILLKSAKYLNNFSLNASFNHFPKRFLSLMSHRKLKTLKLTQKIPSDNITMNLPKYFPAIIENLSLYWSGKAPNMVKFQHPFSIKHLQNLQKLELCFPISINTFKDIIKSIQYPSKLKALKFNLRKESFRDSVDDIGEFLKRCINLKELNVKSSMIDFYPAVAKLDLKKLTIQQFVDADHDLLELVNLIQRQKSSLEDLSLKIEFSGRRSYGHESWFNPLFREIHQLKNLRKLELRLIPYVYSEMLSISALLFRVIEALENLEEIDFEEVSCSFKNLDDLYKALEEKHSKSLKNLKLFLNGCSASGKLIRTLKKLSRLEHLTLHNFTIEEGSNFENQIRDIVCFRNPGLNSLIMREVNRKNNREDDESFVMMLGDIICKPTMKVFSFQKKQFAFSEGFNPWKVLRFSDVMKEVYHFDVLDLPSGTCKPPFHNSNLCQYKWS